MEEERDALREVAMTLLGSVNVDEEAVAVHDKVQVRIAGGPLQKDTVVDTGPSIGFGLEEELIEGVHEDVLTVPDGQRVVGVDDASTWPEARGARGCACPGRIWGAPRPLP